MHKRNKQKKLTEEREYRKENTSNGQRREKYKSMASSGFVYKVLIWAYFLHKRIIPRL